MKSKSSPLFFGINHVKGHGQGMEGILKPYLRPSVRCFLEISSEDLAYIRSHESMVSPEDSETFFRLIRWLDKNKVEIIPLDKNRFRNLLQNFIGKSFVQRRQQDPEFGYYLNQHLRERAWAQVLRLKAKPRDLVVMHPNHLRTFAIREGIPKAKIHLIDPLINNPIQDILPEHLSRRSLREFEGKIKSRVVSEQKKERSKPRRPPHRPK